jgi:hypothetical protein
VLFHDLGHLLEVRCPSIGVSGIVVAQSTVVTCGQPSRETSSTSLGVYIWSRSEEDV